MRHQTISGWAHGHVQNLYGGNKGAFGVDWTRGRLVQMSGIKHNILGPNFSNATITNHTPLDAAPQIHQPHMMSLPILT